MLSSSMLKRAYGVFAILLSTFCYVLFSQTLRISLKPNSDKPNIKIHEVGIPDTFYGDCFAYSSKGTTKLSPETLERNGCKKRLPKAMIVGVKKCGTMMLTHYLSLHPLVAIRGEAQLPQGQSFTAGDMKNWLSEMQLSSSRMFPMTGKPLGFTISTFKHITPLLDETPKLILMIRDPVDRAVSDYVHTNGVLSKMGSKSLLPPFNEMVVDSRTGNINSSDPIVALGFQYIDYFREVTKLVPPDRVLVLDGEAFVQDPLPIMIKTEKFLGLQKFFERKHFQKNPETGFYCANVTERPDFKCANPAIKGRPHPQIYSEVSKKLYKYYRPFNLKLVREANLDFQWLFQ